MKWLAIGITYACVFLYVATALVGAVMALFGQVFVLLILALLGLVGWAILKGRDKEGDP